MWSMLLVVVYAAMLTAKELTYYVDFEHPNVTYWNPKYYDYVNITAQRYSRRDPIHYINLQGRSLIDFGKDVVVDAYIYEFLSNEYRRSMIEVHFNICDVFFKTKYDILKPMYMKYINITSCPFPKGEYQFMNCSVQNLPLLATFPFRKGRVYIYTRYESTRERLAEGYVDGVIKQRFL